MNIQIRWTHPFNGHIKSFYAHTTHTHTHTHTHTYIYIYIYIYKGCPLHKARFFE